MINNPLDSLAGHSTDHETDLAKPLPVEAQRREIFIKCGNRARVYWLDPPPPLYPVLNRYADEREHMGELLKRYSGNSGFSVD